MYDCNTKRQCAKITDDPNKMHSKDLSDCTHGTKTISVYVKINRCDGFIMNVTETNLALLACTVVTWCEIFENIN